MFIYLVLGLYIYIYFFYLQQWVKFIDLQNWFDFRTLILKAKQTWVFLWGTPILTNGFIYYAIGPVQAGIPQRCLVDRKYGNLGL